MSGALLVRLAFSAIAATLAALAAERALRDLGRPGRFAWALALLVSAALSVIIVTGGSMPFALDVLPGLPRRTPLVLDGVAAAREGIGAGALWLASSLVVFCALLATMLVQRHRLGRAARTTVDGLDVVVSGATGPAVIGFARPRIVVPEWLLERPEHERALVVRHEAEHIAARDPLLAGLALLIVCLLPWNPILWYQLARLRLAIELDCDARVLRAGGTRDARVYGRLLVDVAERLARGTPLATALAFPRSFLERRIRMMTTRRHRPLRAAMLTLAAGALFVAACTEDEDPVATPDEPANVSFTIPDTEVPAEYEYLPSRMRMPAADGSEGLARAIYDDAEVRADELEPTLREGRPLRVPFRATLGDDDRPISIEFPEGTPVPLEQEVSGQVRLQQFRRSADDPEAPVEGTFVFERDGTPLRSAE